MSLSTPRKESRRATTIHFHLLEPQESFQQSFSLLYVGYAFVAIGNPERHVRKASHRGSKQQ